MERAGVAGAKALGLGAAQGTAAKIGAAAVKAGVENAIQQTGDEVSKFLSSDPSQTAETAMANITLSGLLGSGIGGAFGAINPLWSATLGAKTAKNLEDVAQGLEEAGQGKIANETVQTLLAEEGAAISGAPKPNVEAIDAAAQRLGITPTTGTRAGEKLAQDIESTLSQRPTFYGQKVQDEVEEVYKGLDQAGLKLFKDTTNKTQAEVGREIKEKVIQKLDNELAQSEAKYEALKPHLKAMEVPKNRLSAAAKSVAKHELAILAPSSKAGIFAKRISKEMNALKTVDDLKTYRTLINRRIDGAVRLGGEELPILQTAKKALTDLREQAIEQAAIDTGIGKGAKGISAEIINELKSADSQYRTLKTKFKDLGTEAGLGKINNLRGLMERFRGSSDESLAKRFFDTGDVNQMRFMKDNFPEAYALARSFKQKEILEGSISHAQGKNGRFEISKFLTQVRKLSPEARREVFGPGLQTISDIQTIYQAMPAKVGPSGTPKGQWLGNLFSPQGLIDNLSDAGKYAMLKAVPYMQKAANDGERAALLRFMGGFDGAISPQGFKAMGDYFDAVINGERALSKSIRGIFKGTRMVLPQYMMPDSKKRERLDKKLQKLQLDPGELMGAGGETGIYLKGEAAHLGQVAAKAVMYLNSLRPAQPRPNPLDTPMPVSKQEQAEFNRALDIAEQPLIVIEDIKDGLISTKDVAVLKTLYPALYNRMAEKMIGEVMETVQSGEAIPYKTRLGLSLFLDQPMDSTLTGESIRAIQASSGAQSAEQQQRQPSATSMQGMEKLANSYMTNQQSRVAQRMKA
jgi:hypothetical protein